MQIKPRLYQGRAGLRYKIKTQISKPIAQVTEMPPSKILVPNTSKIQDTAIHIPNYTIPSVTSKRDTSTKMIDRRIIQDAFKEIPIYPDPVYRPPLKPVKTSTPEIPGSLLDIDPELNTDFEENSLF